MNKFPCKHCLILTTCTRPCETFLYYGQSDSYIHEYRKTIDKGICIYCETKLKPGYLPRYQICPVCKVTF